jgi:hypothetical protein
MPQGLKAAMFAALNVRAEALTYHSPWPIRVSQQILRWFATLDIRSLRHEHFFPVLCGSRHRGGFCGIDTVCHQQQGRWVCFTLMREFGSAALVVSVGDGPRSFDRGRMRLRG